MVPIDSEVRCRTEVTDRRATGLEILKLKRSYGLRPIECLVKAVSVIQLSAASYSVQSDAAGHPAPVNGRN